MKRVILGEVMTRIEFIYLLHNNIKSGGEEGRSLPYALLAKHFLNRKTWSSSSTLVHVSSFSSEI